VPELSDEMLISLEQHWGRHHSEVEAQPVAQLEDLEWADGIAFGTPTRVVRRDARGGREIAVPFRLGDDSARRNRRSRNDTVSRRRLAASGG
jgi:hypothetical protein